MVDDKDISSVMMLLPKDAKYYWAQATSRRAIPASQVKNLGYQHQLQGDDYGSVANAFRQAMADASEDDFIFVGGSSYIVADFLSINHF